VAGGVKKGGKAHKTKNVLRHQRENQLGCLTDDRKKASFDTGVKGGCQGTKVRLPFKVGRGMERNTLVKSRKEKKSPRKRGNRGVAGSSHAVRRDFQEKG